MVTFEAVSEIIPLIVSSAGISGTVFAAIFGFLLKRAKSDAEKKQHERLQLEVMRLEGEEKLSALLFALIRHSRFGGNESELAAAEEAYREYLESNRRLKNEIIGSYTAK